MVKLFKDGNVMGIETDALTEHDFTEEFSDLISRMIDANAYEKDWAFQLGRWLPQFVEICCKMRGYKADVKETRRILCGTGTGIDMVAIATSGNCAITHRLNQGGVIRKASEIIAHAEEPI